MDAVQITTLVLVAGLFLLEGLKITSAVVSANAKRHEQSEVERLMELLEKGEVEGTKTEISISKKED